MSKNDFYKRIKIITVLSVIPFFVAIGPISGYFAGKYFISQFHWDNGFLIVFILLGTLASVIETIKTIKLALKMEKEA